MFNNVGIAMSLDQFTGFYVFRVGHASDVIGWSMRSDDEGVLDAQRAILVRGSLTLAVFCS